MQGRNRHGGRVLRLEDCNSVVYSVFAYLPLGQSRKTYWKAAIRDNVAIQVAAALSLDYCLGGGNEISYCSPRNSDESDAQPDEKSEFL